MNNRKGLFLGETKILSELCDSITDCHHSTPKWTDNGKLVIRNFNIKKGRLSLSDPSFTNDETFNERIKRKRPESGDLIITREAPMGEVCIIPDGLECCLGQRMVLLKPNKKRVLGSYLLYALQSEFVQTQIKKSDKTGSIVSNLRIPVLEQLNIPVFDTITQEKIGSILKNIDSKIEINNSINSELESMAKTLYDYWFVQFDFPDENGKPYKTSGGNMVWNEELKRKIPEGWEVKKINSIIEVKDGTHDSPKPKSEGYRLITSKNLQVSGLDFDNANLISEEDYLSIIKRSNVETGDILFSMIGNIGTIYKIEEKEINFAIKNVALYKTSRMQEHKNYVYMFLKSIDMDRYMKNVISGSIQKFIGLNSLRETPILSNEGLIKKYNEITFSIFEKLENLKLENQKLTELRDWLLPMLMNGQVRVN